MGLVYKTSIIF